MLTGQLKGNKYVIGEGKVRNHYVECNKIITRGMKTVEMRDERAAAERVKGGSQT
jgi:hypothetical protein